VARRALRVPLRYEHYVPAGNLEVCRSRLNNAEARAW